MTLRMTDGEQTITVSDEQRERMGARGFVVVEEDAQLAPGELVGHAIVKLGLDAPLPPGHVARMVGMTDGEQNISADMNRTELYQHYLDSGFLPFPEMPEKRDDQSVVEWQDAYVDACRQVGRAALAARETGMTGG